jgi:hypothetical protein
MLLSGLANRKTAEWAAAYRQSRFYSMFVADRSGKVPSTPQQGSRRKGRGFGLGQWWTLVRRNVILKIRDRAQVIILLVQAPLFAILVGAVFGDLNKGKDDAERLQKLFEKAPGVEFLLVVAAIWFGCNNSARDIVGEWTVYQRERMVSLKLPSYVFSKMTVAAALCLFQCAVLLGIVTLMCGLKADFLQTLAILYLASLVGAALGLCISAIAPTTEAAIAMLPLILLPVISLGGGIHPVHEMSQPVPRIADAVPSRWAYEAAIVAEAEKRPHQVLPPAPAPPRSDIDLAERTFPVGTPRSSLRKCFAVLAGMFALWLAVVLSVLKKKDVV